MNWNLAFNIMVSSPPGAETTNVLRYFIVFLYYPVVFSILSTLAPWKLLGLPTALHIGACVAIVTAVLMQSGMFKHW